MSNTENEPEVKIVERVEVAPAGGDNVDDSENDTQPDSSQEVTNDEEVDEKDTDESSESEGDEDESEEDDAPEPQKKETKNAAPDTTDSTGQLKRVPGESDREFALRLEINRLKTESRRERGQEILTTPPPQAKKELSPEKKKVLEKYKPEDIQTLREVFDVMADDMGFVKKDALQATTYQEKAGEVLDGFLEKHPEYLPQNDPGNVMWGRFKEEFGLYKEPTNPKDLKKVLEKVHKDVFGIKPAAALNKNEAAKEKVKVASHSGSSRPAPSKEGVKRTNVPAQGLRVDMLKGFSDEEIAEFSGGE